LSDLKVETAVSPAETERPHGSAPITRFRDEWYFLSNFSPAAVSFDGRSYPTVEHAYQAARCADETDREAIFCARTPGEAKRIGRAAHEVAGWADIKESVMLDLLRQKFERPGLRDLLLKTAHRRLVEGNDWGDTYWGQVDGVGHNRLGHLLETVRDELRQTRRGSEGESTR
jgi:ribA/ribD-fused uncharacterized protein